MERPKLFEYPIYAVIVGIASAWVFALPPFTYDPSQRSAAEVQAAAERHASGVGEDSTDLTGPDAQSEPRSLARQDGEAAEPAPSSEERTALSEAEADETQLDPQPNLLRVTANSLNMRAEPNARSPRVASYPRGSVVEPVTKQGNWVLVRTVDDATTGWMYAEYLDQVAEN